MYTVKLVSTVVSVRIPKWVREKLEEANVNIAEVVKEALLRKAQELEEKDVERLLDELAAECRGKISPREIARLVEESREEL